MKKDIFKGNIKEEHKAGIIALMIVVVLLCTAFGGAYIYAAIAENYGWIPGLLGIGIILCGPLYVYLSIWVIQRYPKHPVLRRFLLKYDECFVKSNQKKDGKAEKNKSAVASNTKPPSMKHPRSVMVCNVIAVVMLVLFVASFITMFVLGFKRELRPAALQHDGAIVATFFSMAAVFAILLIFFALKAENLKIKFLLKNLEENEPEKSACSRGRKERFKDDFDDIYTDVREKYPYVRHPCYGGRFFWLMGRRAYENVYVYLSEDSLLYTAWGDDVTEIPFDTIRKISIKQGRLIKSSYHIRLHADIRYHLVIKRMPFLSTKLTGEGEENVRGLIDTLQGIYVIMKENKEI